MKIAIISHSDTGGAGLAAKRLNYALRSNKVDSCLVGIDVFNGDGNSRFQPSLISKALTHIPIPIKNNKYRVLQNKLQITSSFPDAFADITKHPVIAEADIINLHWVGGMINYNSFFRKIKKPIVWTLHDMNPFSGFSHFDGDIIGQDQYLTFENKIKHYKAKCINRHNNITIVALCNWMKGLSISSEAFNNRQHFIIPNSVNTDIFRPRPKKLLRELFNLPSDKTIFLFCAQNVGLYRKGFDLILDALEGIHDDCHFIVLGNSRDVPDHVNITKAGSIKDELLMSMYYSAADAFVLPSREDNLPNTMVEALCCGVPVITFDTGGMSDHIVHLKNGVFAPEVSGEGIRSAIRTFIKNKACFSAQNISSSARHIFSPETQAHAYINLFSSILRNSK